ncbi:lipoprotein lipase [Trichonephila clavipes]|nr:lipoprotein lipase [Trichonephila clavipes]
MCVCVCGFQLHNALNIEEHFYHDLLFRTELVEFLVAAVAEWHKYRIIAGLLTSSSSETLKTHRYRYPNFSEYVTNTNFSFWDIERSGFDATAQTVIVIHGFKETGIAWLKRIKDAIFKLDKCNVITVVWGQTESSYEEEKLHLPVIGNDIALFIANLVVSKNIDLQDVYLIGNSMGAHLAGFTGKAIKRKLNSLVGRITGLDPAGPDYYYADATERLAVTDAAFVDVIHTNAACTRLKGMGYPYSAGHFDFFVNGGITQPGCREVNEYIFEMTASELRHSMNYLFGFVDTKTIENLDKYFACSHFRALDIFLASIENDSCEFLSYECSSWDRYLSGECDDHDVTVMGYRADMYKGLLRNSNRMKFYLKTGSVYPYCL